jgi:site-specific DNA-methyltransferase (adenine-specific)
VEREKADGGLFVTLEKPTKPMISEAIDAGNFMVPFTKEEFPKIQILTIEELLNGKKVNLPMGFAKNYYKEAKAVEIDNSKQNALL